MVVLDTIGRSLADAAGMFWETLWALVLGFALSGAVQAFVSRAEMQRALGDHHPKTVAKAGFFGAISSSCSYAASALAKTLFVRGADFTAAQTFMFASTNLVVELGIVLWLLIGWQFAVAEFVGGAIMIALLTLVLPRVVKPHEQAAARDALATTGSGGGDDAHDGHGDPEAHRTSLPWRQRIRSKAGWADAAGYTISDLTMLRKELLIGFVVAGFADAAVPVEFWKSLFLTGHGFWSVLENVVLGPFLAIISFVCSVGNVPLAAALWSGGISFGGTIAFVFADLIALPLLLIYRRYYGTRLTAKLLAAFWATMSLAGLAVEYLFKAARILPAPDTAMHGMVGRDVWGWNYTTVLDIVALVAFAGIYWLYRNRERFGGGAGYAKDPVCGMQVQTEHAPATAEHDGTRYWFCSDHCAHRFTADPEKFVAGADAASEHNDDGHDHGGHGQHDAGATVDPVCGMAADPATAAASAEHDGTTYWFCNPGCRDAFVADPGHYVHATPAVDEPSPSAGSRPILTMADGGCCGGNECACGSPADTGQPAVHEAIDPVCGMTVDPATAPAHADYAGRPYSFCNPGCAQRFTADPLDFLSEAPDPVCGMTVPLAGAAAEATHDGVRYVFCSPGCRDRFAADPTAHLEQPAHQH